MIYQIIAPHFVAGFEMDLQQIPTDPKFRGYQVSQAAPIISYMLGWPMGRVHHYCYKSHWDMVSVSPDGSIYTF